MEAKFGHISFYKTESSSSHVTKRAILFEVSRLFDLLGLLGPSLIIAKLIIQDLWQANISWDETVPLDFNTQWTRLKAQFQNLNQLKVPRYIKTTTDPSRLQVHVRTAHAFTYAPLHWAKNRPRNREEYKIKSV